jgi:hypothetical protein
MWTCGFVGRRCSVHPELGLNWNLRCSVRERVIS